jgi:nucleoside-diphosphate-sugar epimerase
MKILFIGGTGIISTACSALAIERGMELTVLNRSRSPAPDGAQQIVCDINDANAATAALGRGGAARWDVVVDFLAFKPEQVEQRLALFGGRVGQYVFISSASAYQKPPTHGIITESTPLVNPFWDYSRDKIACEERLMRAVREENFPVTIVRPSFTYGHTVFPLAINSWERSYTAIDRMRRGLPVIVPGDGLTLWTMTHNSDFAKGLVGLLGHQAAIGHAFHITSDEALTWDQIYQATAEAAGVAKPKLVHIASDFIVACAPAYAGPLLGDKANCAIFDNTKIKRFVPEFVATTRYRDGIKRSVAWYDADASRRRVDDAANAEWDRIIAAYERGLEAGRASAVE